MFRTSSSATHSLGSSDERGAAIAGASGPLRERILANVRNETVGAPTRSRVDRARSLLLPTAALITGIALGGVSALAFSSGHARTGWRPPLTGAHATLRRIGARAELLVSGMPEPPAREVYEVWLQRRGGAPRPTDALFTVTKGGSANVEVPGGVSGGVTQVLVSNEPLGGSMTPTGQVLVRLKVPGAT